MRAREALGAAALLLVAFGAPTLSGCGGQVELAATPDDAGEEIGHDAKPDAKPDTTYDLGVDAYDAAEEIYVDPLCPDAPAPPTQYKCDPLDSASSCPRGEACQLWVQYPTVPCEHETYGANCGPAGIGTQGTACSSQGCAADYVCIVSGAGNICARTCKPGKVGACPEGLVCVGVDVPGVGACV
jgi:hypothetical protein